MSLFYLNTVVPGYSGTFMSVSGLNPNIIKCKRVFNHLFCPYEDVLKVRNDFKVNFRVERMSVRVYPYRNNLVSKMSSFKVRFKREAPDIDLIQMRAEDHLELCIRNLDGIFLFGKTVTIRCLPDIDLRRFEGTFFTLE
jgi:hypothetical protein